MARTSAKTTNTTKRTNQPKQVLSVKEKEVMTTETVAANPDTVQTVTEPKIVIPKKGSFVDVYTVPHGHNGILNHNAIALGDGVLTGEFTKADLYELGADIDWLLKTGQIEYVGPRLIEEID